MIIFKRMKNIVVLSGAGMSAESGLKTFRDANGLWEGHDVMQVASPEGFASNPELVLEFYNQRRRQLLQVVPNKAHYALANLEKHHNVSIVTQNVDDLHERAGSSNILHLHGELLKVRSSKKEHLIYHWENDLVLGDVCEYGHQLRPHIVWFGEEVPELYNAVEIVNKADALLIIGTSLQVYPAASLLHYAPMEIPMYYIDPNPAIGSTKNLKVIAEPATVGVEMVIEELVANF